MGKGKRVSSVNFDSDVLNAIETIIKEAEAVNPQSRSKTVNMILRRDSEVAAKLATKKVLLP